MQRKRTKLLHKARHLNRRTIRVARKATRVEFAHGKRPVAVILKEAVESLRHAADLLAVAGAAQ